MLRNLGFIGIHKKKSKLFGDIDRMIKQNNDIPLDDILSEDAVVDELQNQNETLIKYLNKERVKQMIDYIIIEPPADSTQKRGYKFPWICSQLFNIGDYNIMKYFLRTNTELEEEEKLEQLQENNDEENKPKDNNDNVINEEKEKEKENKDNKTQINEIVKKKEKDNRIELLDYLLTFLSSDKEPNYVLCGYFASIIKTLLNMEQTVVIKYLYLKNKEFIRKLIYHSYRQSISEILNKIIQYNPNVDEFDVEEMSLIRMDILEGLFDKIDMDMDTEKLDSISTLIKSLATDERLLSDMLNNRKIIECLISRPFRHINLLKNNDKEEIVINKRRNFIILIDIIICWLHYINTFEIDLPWTNESDEDENENENNNKKEYTFTHTLLSYELFNVLFDLIKINFNKKQDDTQGEETKILQCYDEKLLVPLGLYRIKIVELLGNLFTYFKKVSILYDQLLIDSQFFENAFEYLFEYEFNNIYQEALLFLLKKFLNYSKDHSLLADHLFLKLNLLETIITKLKDTDLSEKEEENSKKDRFLYKSGNSTSRGYVSFLISLAYKINTIIGGEPLRINNTLSREGSISFITRTAPFVGKEEINKFYGMDEDELYEAVSNESREKTSKLNCSVKSMEKYMNEKWSEYFSEHISDKILLYETKLLKEENRDSIFRNPFVMDNEEENTENKKDVGRRRDTGDENSLEALKNNGISDFEKFLYEENPEIDINVNRFKMSMRLPRSNKNSMVRSGSSKKRNSLDDKPSKVVVDEIDIDSVDANDNNNNDDEEENPLDKFRRLNSGEKKEEKKDENEDEEENPLDKFRRLNSGDKKGEKKDENEDEEENPLDKFRRLNNGEKKDEKKDENDDDENPLDKFRRLHNEDNNNNEEKEDDNPLDKFRKINEDEYNEENKEDNPLDQFRKMIHKNSKESKENNKDEAKDENPLDKFRGTNNGDNNEDEEENPLDKFKKMNGSSSIKKNEDNKEKEDEDDNPLDKFKEMKGSTKKEDEDDNPLDKFREMNSSTKKEDEDENPLDKFKEMNNSTKKEDNNNNKDKNDEDEEENPLDKFRRLNNNSSSSKKNDDNNKDKDKNKDEEEEENPLDILRGLKSSKKNDDNNEEEDEDALDLFNKIRNKNKNKENTEDDKDENPLDLLRELRNRKKEDNNEDNNNNDIDEDEDILDKFRKNNDKEK